MDRVLRYVRILRLRTSGLVVLLVMEWDGARYISYARVGAFCLGFGGLVFIVCLFQNTCLGHAIRLFHAAIVGATFGLHNSRQGVVDIGRAILVSVAVTSMSFGVKVTLSRSYVVNVEYRIVTIGLAINIGISLGVTFHSKRLRCVSFLAKTMITSYFYGK